MRILKPFAYLIFFGFSLSLVTQARASSISRQIEKNDLRVVIDYSAIIDKKLNDEGICNINYTPTKLNSSGTPIKMLGFAHVYMGPGPGSSIHGHLGERFVYCIGEKIFDVYFDGVRLDEKSLELFQLDYPSADQSYVQSAKAMGGLYYRKVINPTKLSLYGMDTVQANRNIYEQWLDISEDEIYDLLLKNIERKKEQAIKISNNGELDRFSGLGNNCTFQVTEDLQSIESFKSVKVPFKVKRYKSAGYTTRYRTLDNAVKSVQPKYIYQALAQAKITKLLVIYPSQDNMRKVFFNNLSFEDSIKALEVPVFKFKPKYSDDWSRDEKDQLVDQLEDYLSPLARFFKETID